MQFVKSFCRFHRAFAIKYLIPYRPHKMPVPDNNSVNIYDLPIRFYSLHSEDKALYHALELRIMYWTWSEADIRDPASVAV
jgi:hypothetical protein